MSVEVPIFVDVYSLGLGPVEAEEPTKVFGIRNYQVLRGYVLRRIPKAVLQRAIGPQGEWRPGGDPPALEIVPHHEEPSFWKRLPAQFRSAAVQENGYDRELEPIPRGHPDRRLFPPGVRPMRLKEPPAPLPEEPLNIEELIPGFTSSLELGLTPRPKEKPLKRPVLEASAPNAPKISDLSGMLILGGEETPIGIVSQKPEKHEPAETAAPEGCCKASKANGRRCLRPGTVDGFCGFHAKQR